MVQQVSPTNAFFKKPVSKRDYKSVDCGDFADGMRQFGLNSILAMEEDKYDHQIGGCAMRACFALMRQEGSGCNLTHVIELAAPHKYRPSHYPGGGGGPVIHGAAWTAMSSLAFDADDKVVWSDLVLKMLCPWQRPSASLIFDCIHGVGHGASMRAPMVVSLREHYDAKKGEWPTQYEQLKYALGLCAAAPTRHIAYDCSIGAYMGFGIARNPKAFMAPGQPADSVTKLSPCGQPGLPFAVVCFQDVFFELAGSTEDPTTDFCLGTGDDDSLPTEDLKVSCIHAQAMVFFTRHDGFSKRFAQSKATDKRSRLTFLQGSGYEDGQLKIAEESAMCNEACGSVEKPTTLREYCEAVVGAYYTDGDEDGAADISPLVRRRWLACVAGGMALGENALVGDLNIATAVDTWDVPAFIVRRVCSQLRFGPAGRAVEVWRLGFDAAALCERAALYYASTTSVTLEDYAPWPLEVLEPAA